MHITRTWIWLPIVSTTWLGQARADAPAGTAADTSAEASGIEIGHMPLLEAGVMGGFSTVPFARPDRTGCTEDCDDNAIGGLFGVEARLNLDLDKALFIGSGHLNAVGGDTAFIGRAQIVFGAGLGGRSTVNLSKPVASYSTPQYDVTVSKIYLRKKVPIFYGVELGGSVFQMNDTTDGTAPVPMRPATMLTSIDAGFAVVSPQFTVVAAPAYELTTGMAGMHWEWRVAFPVASYPIYFRMEGSHYWGDDNSRRLGTLLMAGLGIGSSLGVNAD